MCYHLALKCYTYSQGLWLQEKLAEYEQFERLLYSTGLQLEEAIAFSLNWLGFLNVTHLKGDKDNPDITFDYEEFHALVEAEGTNKQMSKDKVNQLGGWIQKELDREVEVSNIFGFLVINAFREKDLKERGDPLTQHAKNFLGVYRKMRYFRTSYLHEVVVRVLKGDLSKEAARKNIWEGEEIQ